MAVTKTRAPEEVEAVIEAGVMLLGESRVQEAERKLPAIRRSAEWHLVGHLQTNKAKRAVELFSTIQSVDSLRLAERIAHFTSAQKPTDVLVEVNTSGELSKFGVAPDAAVEFVGALRDLPGVRIRGFMTVGALASDESPARRCFERLRRIREQARSAFPGLGLEVLSMGMTNDFVWAVAEGSTMVRIGTAIFGPRPLRT